jgi:hypothetical protein
MQSEYMPDDADEKTVSLYLEAYILWLFGFVMFCNTQGHAVDRFFLKYAEALADVNNKDCNYNWGAAVLAYTYEGLTNGCTNTHKLKEKDSRTLSGCPLLINIFIYERFKVFRPIIKAPCILPSPNNIDGPTMGSKWCRNEVRTLHNKNLNSSRIPVNIESNFT